MRSGAFKELKSNKEKSIERERESGDHATKK